MTDQFESALKVHLRWLADEFETWTWHTWELISGDRVGQYLLGTFGHRWADLDAHESFSAAAQRHWRTHVERHVQSVRSSVYRYHADASHLPVLTEPSQLSQMLTVEVREGRTHEFEEALRKIKSACEEKKISGHCRWYELVTGGAGPEFVAHFPLEAWADFDRRESSLRGVVEHVFPGPAAEPLLLSFQRSVLKTSTELARYRSDLSYVPGRPIVDTFRPEDFEDFTTGSQGKPLVVHVLGKHFSTEPFEAVTTDVSTTRKGNVEVKVWRGYLKDDPIARSVVAISREGVSGYLQRRGIVYRFDTRPGRVLHIYRVHQKMAPPDGPPDLPPEKDTPPDGGGSDGQGGGGGFEDPGIEGLQEEEPQDEPPAVGTPAPPPSTPTTIRILVLIPNRSENAYYASSAEDKARKEAELEKYLHWAFETFAGGEPGVPTNITTQVVIDLVEHDPEGGDLQHDLDWLADGGNTAVTQLRKHHAADLVCMMVDSADPDYSGRGKQQLNVPSAARAFSVVVWRYATEIHSFPHELGHNLGMLHSIHDSKTSDTTDDCNFGHVVTWYGLETGRTIMAGAGHCDDKGVSCPRYLYYSRDHLLDGEFTLGRDCCAGGGDATTAPAMNLFRLKDLAPAVSQFMPQP